VWILDDITPLQQLTPEVLGSDVHLFEQRPFTRWERIQKSDPRMGYQVFSGDNVDSSAVPIDFYLGSDPVAEIVIEISRLDGKKHTAIVDGAAGVQQYRWNLQFDGPALNDAQVAYVDEQLVTMIEELDDAEAPEGGLTGAELQARLAEYRVAADDPHRIKAIRGVAGVRVGPVGGGRGGRGGGRGGRGGFGAWGEPAGTGEFLVTMTVGDITQTTMLVVKEDPIRQQR
jgi:hypothetical protein